ncbi:DUF4349 domain-containing protein [Lentibacillus salicampi]|nr:DUF4349 domain-containing protein [Lentibacillus salicampi]
MKKGLLILIITSIGLLAAACSNESKDSESTADRANMGTEKFTTENNSVTDTDVAENGHESASSDTDRQGSNASDSNAEDTAPQADESTQADRKIIYTANLRIEVADYQDTVGAIQAEVSDRGGYIVESNMHEGTEKGTTTGQVTARVPQDQFEEFVETVKNGSKKVVDSSTSGRDVTEEFVDLESRLESKRVVEERLQSFMEEADKTEDLLKISDDLSTVQQEIEEITGRMTYLENKIDLATVTIQIEENNVAISSEDDLNTWEKTKQQFMQSINFLLAAFSGFVVFIVGNLPVLMIVGIIGIAVSWVIRKWQKSHPKS